MCTFREGETIDRIDAFATENDLRSIIILLNFMMKMCIEKFDLPCSFTNNAITERITNTIEIETGYNRNVAMAECTQRMLTARNVDKKKKIGKKFEKCSKMYSISCSHHPHPIVRAISSSVTCKPQSIV